MGAEVFHHPLRLAHCRGDSGERTLMKGTWTFAPNSQSERRGDRLQRVAQLRLIRYACLVTLRRHCSLTLRPQVLCLPLVVYSQVPCLLTLGITVYLLYGTRFGFSDIPVCLPSDTLLFTILFTYSQVPRLFTLRYMFVYTQIPYLLTPRYRFVYPQVKCLLTLRYLVCLQ